MNIINFKYQSIKDGLLLLGAFGSSLIVYFSLKFYRKIRKYQHIPGPKSTGFFGFITGNYFEMVEASEKGQTFSDKLLEWNQKYGPVFKLNFFGEILISVSDIESIKLLLIDKDLPKNQDVYKLIGYPLRKRCLGNGLVTETDKDEWRKKRTLFNHGFHRNILMNNLKEFNHKTDILMQNLITYADGNTVITLINELNKFTLDVISSVAFGINSEYNSELNLLINKLLVGLNDIMIDPYFIQFRPSKSSIIKDFKYALNELRKFSKEHISNRIKSLEDKDYVPNDILSIIIQNYQDKFLNIEDLIDEFMTFFIAGQETTANSLAFCILELGRNPDVLEKLKNEVVNVLGSKTEINYDDLAKLEYTGCVFKESLRKYPPAPEFSRRTLEDFEINGYKIPKNSWITFSPFLTGRNPNFFPNPDDFIPERFLKDSEIANQNKVSSYTFFPFSIGPRNCIGQNFAQMEGKIFLAKFIQNFDFELDTEQSFKTTELLTLRPKDGCRIKITTKN